MVKSDIIRVYETLVVGSTPAGDICREVNMVFTEDQVASLKGFQSAGIFHPFTCECGAGDMIPTTEGFVCPNNCGYTQDWAHDFMLNWEWQKMDWRKSDNCIT